MPGPWPFTERSGGLAHARPAGRNTPIILMMIIKCVKEEITVSMILKATI